MQDFRTYSYTLTVEQAMRLIAAGTVKMLIINGEYYDVVKGKEEEDE